MASCRDFQAVSSDKEARMGFSTCFTPWALRRPIMTLIEGGKEEEGDEV
jgi:hypothetical protein